MAIISISRGAYSGGKQLAGLLARRLGYGTASRRQLYQQVEQDYGLSAGQVSRIMEQAPGQLELSGDRSQRVRLGQRRRRLFYALQASLCKLLSGDDMIYYGHAGHLLLPGSAQLLRLRLVAEREQRIAAAMERDRLRRAEATARLDLADAQRRRWTASFYGSTWGDPGLFDMVLNLHYMNLEEAASMAAHAAGLPSYASSAVSRQTMADIALDARITARLLSHPNTRGLELDVTISDGAVRITGDLGDAVQEVDRVVRAEGVQNVSFPGVGDTDRPDSG